MPFGLFSSKSKSTTSTTVDEQNNSNVDNRVTEGENVNIGGNISINAGENLSSVSVTTTDFGAVDAGADIAISAVSASKNIANNALNIANEATQNATEDSQASITQLAIIAGALVAVFVFIKR